MLNPANEMVAPALACRAPLKRDAITSGNSEGRVLDSNRIKRLAKLLQISDLHPSRLVLEKWNEKDVLGMSKHGAVLTTRKSARRVLVGATTIEVDSGDQWSHYCIPRGHRAHSAPP